jgi:hypothetical protein
VTVFERRVSQRRSKQSAPDRLATAAEADRLVEAERLKAEAATEKTRALEEERKRVEEAAEERARVAAVAAAAEAARAAEVAATLARSDAEKQAELTERGAAEKRAIKLAEEAVRNEQELKKTQAEAASAGVRAATAEQRAKAISRESLRLLEEARSAPVTRAQLDKFKAHLLAGMAVTKHCRDGTSRSRLLYSDASYTKIGWKNMNGEKSRTTTLFALKDIINIRAATDVDPDHVGSKGAYWEDRP